MFITNLCNPFLFKNSTLASQHYFSLFKTDFIPPLPSTVPISTEFLINFQQQKNIVLNELKFTSLPPKKSKASLKSRKLSNIHVHTSKNKFTTAFPCQKKKMRPKDMSVN